jgi:hypothetical protein
MYPPLGLLLNTAKHMTGVPNANAHTAWNYNGFKVASICTPTGVMCTCPTGAISGSLLGCQCSPTMQRFRACTYHSTVTTCLRIKNMSLIATNMKPTNNEQNISRYPYFCTLVCSKVDRQRHPMHVGQLAIYQMFTLCEGSF